MKTLTAKIVLTAPPATREEFAEELEALSEQYGASIDIDREYN